MKPFQYTKKIIFLAFLLSLLFHFSSVIIVFVEKNNQQVIQQKTNPEEWVETKARAGHFGLPAEASAKERAPVMFVNNFVDFEASLPDAIEDKSFFINTAKSETEDIPENFMKQAQIIPQKTESFEPTIDLSDQKNTTVTSSQFSVPTTIHHEQKSIPKKIRSRAPRKSETPKPPLTLAQLARGFLDHMKNEGTHAIHMLGKKRGTPSDQQIKYERYVERLGWCFQNSVKTSKKFYFNIQYNTEIWLFFALNRDGSIRDLQIRKSSGYNRLDEFLLSAFRDASTSFPPVPHYLPHDPFRMTFTITLPVEEPSNIRFYAGPR